MGKRNHLLDVLECGGLAREWGPAWFPYLTLWFRVELH